ncbi:DUF1440 domain-containing protein [Tundrisphaera sp. TA3]|uniref:DUF1440 domain-containing protein n=1 Tax=Tundrisphaera sp. TA3 TaxID=3435775 RepID=UPI003EB82E12
MTRRDGLLADALFGAIAGTVATLAMNQVTSRLYEAESPKARRREDRARGGLTALEIAAGRVADAVGADLSAKQQATAGEALHWALGIGAGALYGVLRPRVPASRIGRGLAFGTAFWVLADEIAVPAAGLTPGPAAFPWQTHARALLGHLAFGLAADAALSAVGALRKPATEDARRAQFEARLEAVGGPFARRLAVG